jgi:hypothetical protein
MRCCERAVSGQPDPSLYPKALFEEESYLSLRSWPPLSMGIVLSDLELVMIFGCDIKP